MNYKISPINYSKMILKKVSFSPSLFERELKKAIEQCQGQHLEQLKRWCIKKFWGSYAEIIRGYFGAMEMRTTA